MRGVLRVRRSRPVIVPCRNPVLYKGGFAITVPTPQKTRSKKVALKDLIVATLDADKAEQIETIPLHDQTALADFMIVASGRSARQVGALADRLVDKLTENGYKNIRVEGQRQADWIVVDVGDVIVHLFRPEVRAFYNIEKMWRGAHLFPVESDEPIIG